MKLIPEQIDRLYQFTRQHYVEYYDLQTELVDHLANSIEAEWQENPKLTFEVILQKEFKKFGVFGFMDVVEKRQAALNRKYNGIIWKHFKAFFELPKIIGTVVLITALFYFFKFNDHNIKIIKILFLIQFVIVFFAMVKQKMLSNNKELKPKKWLLEKTIYNCGNLGAFFTLPLNISTIISNNITKATNSYALFGMSCFLVVFGLFFYIILFEIPKKAEDYLKATYPEYALETNL
jgi:hypothetical protein